MLVYQAFVNARSRADIWGISPSLGTGVGGMDSPNPERNGVPHLFIGVVYKYPYLPLNSQRGQWPR